MNDCESMIMELDISRIHTRNIFAMEELTRFELNLGSKSRKKNEKEQVPLTG
jgi:hypothetical protein